MPAVPPSQRGPPRVLAPDGARATLIATNDTSSITPITVSTVGHQAPP